MSIQDLRKEYMLQGLSEADLEADPLAQFSSWFDQAVAARLIEPNAMTLATVAPDGRPSARIVLMKSFGPDGFVFFSNYESRKGQELAANPFAALVFYWPELERQVRVEGRVAQVAPAESDSYWASRPRGARIGSLASHQSRPIPRRGALEERVTALLAEYEGRSVPRPPFWGGYRVIPDSYEFWQGRASRLHDRIHYTHGGNGAWTVERLSP